VNANVKLRNVFFGSSGEDIVDVDVDDDVDVVDDDEESQETPM
jgi:hypothetical protein